MSDPNAWVVDVDARTFEKEVIQRSRTLPVLVDFWAAWCGPCKALSPLLERRARDGAGRFLLAKVDIDANPDLAQAFRVQSIPAVLALVGGRLVDGFQGALPEPELDAFLDRIAPAGPSANEELLASARALAEAGEQGEAIKSLRQHLRQSPEDAPVRLLLAGILLDDEKAREAGLVFAKLPEAVQASVEGRALAARMELDENRTELEPLEEAVAAAPEDAGARLALGRALVAARRYERGLEELLATLRLEPGGSGAEAKTAMLEVFELLGMEDPLANDYRFKLSLELFA